MDNAILNFYQKIPIPNVSRETCFDFESLISMIREKNNQINIISKKTSEINEIRERHIISTWPPASTVSTLSSAPASSRYAGCVAAPAISRPSSISASRRLPGTGISSMSSGCSCLPPFTGGAADPAPTRRPRRAT